MIFDVIVVSTDSTIVAWIRGNLIASAVIAWCLSVLIGFVPAPRQTGFTSLPGYVHLYQLLHAFAGNIDRVLASVTPESLLGRILGRFSSSNKQGEQ